MAGQRFDPRAEAAAYFVVVEALRYADELVRGVHVTVTLSVDDEWLRFAVAGERCTFGASGCNSGPLPKP